MRLLTAIPLLFWTSTAAIAHLALILAAQPVAPVTHAQKAESSIASADHGTAVPSAESRFAAASAGILVCRPTVDEPVLKAVPTVPQPGVRRLTEGLLRAARLSANPPPAHA